MARILCVEDSSEFFLYITSVLKEHTLVQAASIKDALTLLSNGRETFNLILLDISLPDGNGLKILPQIKELIAGKAAPIVVLSSDSDVVSKVAAFGIGADDFISKPPEVAEFRARIDARLRAAQAQSSQSSMIRLGDLTLDTDKMTLECSSYPPGERNINLTPFEFKILKLMGTHPGHVYSRDQIIDAVWGYGKHITARTIDAHVSNLRKKILKSQVQVETVLGFGYKILLKSDN